MNSPVSLLFFSPVGSTEKIAKRISELLSSDIVEYDLTSHTIKSCSFCDKDIVVIAVPVFSGRVPVTAINNIRKFRGNGAKVISVVVYGNRAYDDALLELNDLLNELEFTVIASGAFIAQHSVVKEIGAERPDAEDFAFIDKFAYKIIDKITSNNINNEITVPGNRPYKQPQTMPIIPTTSPNCVKCGLCVKKCPAEAINNNCEIIAEKCILCMRCVKICGQKARFLPEPFLKKAGEMLKLTATNRKDNEIFF